MAANKKFYRILECLKGFGSHIFAKSIFS